MGRSPGILEAFQYAVFSCSFRTASKSRVRLAKLGLVLPHYFEDEYVLAE